LYILPKSLNYLITYIHPDPLKGSGVAKKENKRDISVRLSFFFGFFENQKIFFVFLKKTRSALLKTKYLYIYFKQYT